MKTQKTEGDKPLKTTTTKTSKRKTLSGEPRKVKSVEKVYSDYPLKNKNLVQKTTTVNKKDRINDGSKQKTKTVTNPRIEVAKTVTKNKIVTNPNYIKERSVKKSGVNMFNPLSGNERKNKEVTKKVSKR
jgi:hypothetical protein